MFTLLVKDLYGSYKDLPLSIYQIQTKYRDEARPRAASCAAASSSMKDSYSFDIDDAGLEASYQGTARPTSGSSTGSGFDYVIVKAISGAMGGSASRGVPGQGRRGRGHLRPLHELRLRRERRGSRVPPRRSRCRRRRRPPRTPSDTPDTPTIETLVDHLNAEFPREDRPWTAADTLKNVVVVLATPTAARGAGRRAAGRPRGRPQAARGRARAASRSSPSARPTSPAPRAGQGLHRPRGAGGAGRGRRPLPGRPARGRGHALGDRRRRDRQPRARPGRRARLHARRLHRGRRGPRR